MNLKKKEIEILDNFAFFDEWEERYQYIIDLGKKLDPYPPLYKKDAYLVKGCQSKVWLYGTLAGPHQMKFYASAESLITQGLVALTLWIYQDASPQDIQSFEPQFFNALGLGNVLSPSRSNGIHAMLKHIKNLASLQQ